MTIDNYTQMSNEELIESIYRFDIGFSHLSRYLKKHEQKLWNELVLRSSFLKDDEPLNARIYCVLNNIHSYPCCHNEHCHNKTRWKEDRFLKFCCRKCQYESIEFKNSIKETCNIRYGVDNPLQSKTIREKIKQTCIERYGVDNPIKSNEIQEKIKKTNIERYGVEHALQSKEIHDKTKQTNLERYGNICSLRNEFVQQKSRETIMQKYGVDYVFQSDVVKDKIKSTNIQKYGVEYVAQSIDIRMKIKDTCIKRYGVDCSLNSIDSIAKTKETNLLRYGVENPMQNSNIRSKAQETLFNRYGVYHPLQSELFIQKSIMTSFERYGVEWYQQSNEYHKNKNHKYKSIKYSDLTFDSTWEMKVYEFCRDNDIQVEYSPNISFEYDWCGKHHTYHPDFKIGNRIFEVKGDQFFNESKQMVNPYDHSQDDKYEAKHQCMLDNDVKILRGNDIENLTIELFK